MKHRRIYLIILALIASWYVVVFMHLTRLDAQQRIDADTSYHFPILSKDSAEYAKLAENILQHRLFSLRAQPPFVPETFRTPGYPLFVAGIVGITHSYDWFSLPQVILLFLPACLYIALSVK